MDNAFRAKGTLAAVGLSALVATLAFAAGHLEILMAGGIIGVPVGGALAFASAPRVAAQSAGRAFESALAMAGKAVILGDLLVSALLVVWAAAGAEPAPVDFFGAFVALPLFGPLFFGLPAFVLAFGVILPWTFAIRRLGRESASADERLRPGGSPAARS